MSDPRIEAMRRELEDGFTTIEQVLAAIDAVDELRQVRIATLRNLSDIYRIQDLEVLACTECGGKGTGYQRIMGATDYSTPWGHCRRCGPDPVWLGGVSIDPDHQAREVSQYELYLIATDGTAGDGTEDTPTFWIAETGHSLPVGMPAEPAWMVLVSPDKDER